MSATTTRDAKADAALALLCERWPKCFFMFQGRRLPLKIGIHKDIPDGLIEPTILRLAFRLYVNSSGYLNAMRLGAARIDLNGNPVGIVSDDDSSYAKSIVALREAKAARRKREAGKQAARRQQKQAVEKTPPAVLAPAPSHAPAPSPAPARRDSLSSLREAARKRGGVV